MLQFLWKSFITLFVVINPVAVIATFVSLTSNFSSEKRNKIALKAVFISTILLVAFAIIGDKLLDTMSISESAFRIAGGFLLLLSAIEMVVRTTSANNSKLEDVHNGTDISVYPLAIPLIAGPGALTSIVVLMRQAELYNLLFSFGVVLILITVLLITYLGMLGGNYLMRMIGISGANVMTRVCGIMLAALAIQNIITGIVVTVKNAFNLS